MTIQRNVDSDIFLALKSCYHKDLSMFLRFAKKKSGISPFKKYKTAFFAA